MDRTVISHTGPETMLIDAMTRGHEIASSRNTDALDELLADEAVFHSPVVHTPQVGKKIAQQYLTAAFHVLFNDTFQYVREIRGNRDAVLEFEVEIDGIHVNGVDLIKWNDAGQIVELKVMLRPLKAINLIHQKMGELLQKS